MVIHLLTHYTRETNKLVEVDNKCGHRNDLQKGLVLATLARLEGGGGGWGFTCGRRYSTKL